MKDKAAVQRFRSAASATRKVFDDALDAMQVKAALEIQAAVYFRSMSSSNLGW